jgi:hypothetical protein
VEGDGLILFWDTSGIISQKFRALVLFKGCISIAYGDLNGDGALDIINGVGVVGDPCKRHWVGLQ